MTRIVLDADGGRHTISRHVYGHTFDDPHAARIAPFDDARYADGALHTRLPAMSVVAVQIG